MRRCTCPPVVSGPDLSFTAGTPQAREARCTLCSARALLCRRLPMGFHNKVAQEPTGPSNSRHKEVSPWCVQAKVKHCVRMCVRGKEHGHICSPVPCYFVKEVWLHQTWSVCRLLPKFWSSGFRVSRSAFRAAGCCQHQPYIESSGRDLGFSWFVASASVSDLRSSA